MTPPPLELERAEISGRTWDTPPYSLQTGLSYQSLSFGGGVPTYSGPAFEGRIGTTFSVNRDHHFFLNGVFRRAELSAENSPNLSLAHFGVEAGYELAVNPDVFSLFTFFGIGTNIFNGDGLNMGGGLFSQAISNQVAPSLSLGGGFTVARGLLHFFAGWQPFFGLSVPVRETDPPTPFNPSGYFIGGTLDLARFVDWVGGEFSDPPSFESFMDGLQSPKLLIFGDAGFQFSPPTSGDPSLRMTEMRLILQRSVDERHPLGFGLNLAAGAGWGQQPGSPEPFTGPYFEFEEAYLHLRLPIARGILVQGGKFFMSNQAMATSDGVYFTTIGLEDHESPNNNQITHSYQFHYAFPLSFGSARMQIPFSDSVMMSIGALHNWDQLFGPQSGNAGFATLAAHLSPALAVSASGFAGLDAGRFFSVLNLQGLMCLPATGNCSMTNARTRFNLGTDYTYGHRDDGDWHAYTLFSRLNFNEYVGISARGEVFFDPRGVRTGMPQILWETSGTFHVQPQPWMRLRAEIRHDESSARFFPSTSGASSSQNTFSLGGAFIF